MQLNEKALRYAFAAYEEEYTEAINDEGVDCISAEQRGIAKAIIAYLDAKPERESSEVPEQKLSDALFHAGEHWADTLTAKQIENVLALFKTLGWRVEQGRRG